MWPTIIICGVVAGHLDCVQMGEQTLPLTAVECQLKLGELDRMVAEFKIRHPETQDYIEAWRGCEHVPGEET